MRDKKEQLRDFEQESRHENQRFQDLIASQLYKELGIARLSEDQISDKLKDITEMRSNFDLQAKRIKDRLAKKQKEHADAKGDHDRMASAVAEQESQLRQNKAQVAELEKQAEALVLEIENYCGKESRADRYLKAKKGGKAYQDSFISSLQKEI